MWVVFLIIGLALLLGLALVCVIIGYKRNYWHFLNVPHEEPKSIFSIMREIKARDMMQPDLQHDADVQHLQLLYQRFRQKGPFCGFYRMLRPTALITDRELIKQILFKDFSNFNDRGKYFNQKHDPLSAHLFNASGECWKERRPNMESLLSEESVRHMYASFQRESQTLLVAFEAARIMQGEHVRCKDLVQRHICDTIARCIYGLQQQGLQDPLPEFYEMTQQALKVMRHGTFVQGVLYRYPAVGRKLGYALTPRKVHAYFTKLITNVVGMREHRHSQGEHKDFVQLMMQITSEKYRYYASDAELGSKAADAEHQQRMLKEMSAIAFGFLHTAYESTVHTLVCALHELALNQELQERVRQEVLNAMRRHDNELTYDCVTELQLLGQIILETIRLYPITPYLTRRALHEYPVPNNQEFILPGNIYIIIPVHAIHNDPEYFPDPHLFKPERFASRASQSRDLSIWFGFGEGPRNCVGMRYAQVQMSLALAQLITHFRFSVDLRRPMPSWEEGMVLMVEKL